MDINQNIRKKLTAQEIGLKNVNTSFLMLPLRLETKFIDKKPVEKIIEPERAYYVFSALWDIIRNVKSSDIKLKIREVHYIVDELDVLFKEDKAILIRVMRALKNILPEEAEMRDDWEVLIGKVDRVGTVDSMKFNKATIFLDKLEYYTNRLNVIKRRPPYNGKNRLGNESFFSQTAKYKAAHKHLRECIDFFWSINSELDKISMMNKDQKSRFFRLIRSWKKLTTTRYEIYNGSVKEGSYVLPSVKLAYNQFSRLVQYYNGEVDCIDEKSKVKLKFRREDLKNSYRNRVTMFMPQGSPLRYSTVVGMLMQYAIKDELSGKCLSITKRLKHNLKRTEIQYDEHSELVTKIIKESQVFSQETLDKLMRRHFKMNTDNSRAHIIETEEQKCLCVRIYPDDIAVTQTLKRLSKNEYLTGRDFWLKYVFNTDEKVRQSLWLGVCDYFPAYRAAWIVKKTFPKDHFTLLCKRAEDFRLEKRSFEEFCDEVEANILNVFPMTYVDTDNRDFTVPTTELLPDRFVLHAEMRVKGGKKLTISRYGHKLPHSLQLGLDMNDLEHAVDEDVKSDDFVKLSGNLRWMTDYDKAEKMGMAITLPLDEFGGKGRQFEFDSLYVLGVNEESEDECERILTDLLESHMYSSDGYDLIKIGTPTNIISGEDEAYFDTSEDALVEKYKHQAINCVSPTPISETEDIFRIEQLLGLKESVLGNLKDPKNTEPNQEIHKAMVVNKTLIDVVDNSLVKLFKKYPILREFLSNDVLSRGAFPPVRIGNQPYGILPICDFKRLDMGVSIMQIVKEILVFLTNKWNDVADNMTQYSGDGKNADDFLAAVGSTPVSSYFQKVTYVKQDGELLLKPSFFKFGDTLENAGEILVQDIMDILKRHSKGVSKSEITKFMDGYDQTPIVEEDLSQEPKYTVDVKDVQMTNLIAAVRKQFSGRDIVDEEIKTLILEFFDLFSYRLDAWMMGLLNHKLHHRFSSKTHRVGLGTFGWVFNLKESDNNSKENKDEYILAPSINHAITGAVMRSAYNNGVDGVEKDYNLDVQLTSRRVRSAIRIIEGIQNGLALGTILGTDLERLMHESYKTTNYEMDEGIFVLRKRYPMISNEEVASGQEVNDNDITVINGLSLLKDVKSGSMKYSGIFKNNETEKVKVLKSLISEVQQEYDSLTDVILSEAVYKLTQGQREAVDGLIKALNKEKNIPMPEVTEIPITSAQVDGNLVVALDPNAKTEESALLAKVEPKVENWLQNVLGFDKGNDICCVDSESSKPISLRDLGISASEMVYLSANKSLFVKYLTLKNWMETGQYLNMETDVNVENSLSYDEVEMTLDNLREMLSNAHALKNGDIVKETGLDDAAVYATMQDMYDKTHETINFMCQEMTKILANPFVANLISTEDMGTIVPDQVVKDAVVLMLDCFSIGQTTALDSIEKVMLSGGNTKYDNTQDFYDAVKAQRSFFNSMAKIKSDMEESKAKAMDTVSKAETKDYNTYITAIKKMLVGNMLLVPSFQPDENVPLGLFHKQKSGKYFSQSEGKTMGGYIIEMSKVSEQMMHMHQVRMFQKFNGIKDQRVVPMQIPVNEVDGKRMWLGQEVDSEEYVYDAFTYLMVQPENLPSPKEEHPQIAAIVFDHWIERIPYQDQTAGLAFNYDQPDAEAPQTLLMAVSTKDGVKNHWSEQMLLRTIRSTMHLVKSRAVEPDDLREHPWTSAVFPLISYEDLMIK